MQKNKLKNIGVVLSGGGARANAHIGVLQALNENGIYPTHISGSSAGALIGALYCSGYTPNEILELAKSFEFLKIFKIGFLNKGLTEMTRLRKFLHHHIKDDFASLKISLYISVTNLNSGNCEIISKGQLIDIILASCAIPLLFKPIKINSYLYVDGGLTNNFPVEPLLNHCYKIIGVNVSSHTEKIKISGIIEITERCLQLSVWNTVKDRIDKCDVFLDINNTVNYTMFSIKKSQELYVIGYNTTIDKMDVILKAIQ